MRRGSKRLDPYAVLGVSRSASNEEVRGAWRKLASTLHPDKHPNASDAERAEFERKFKEQSTHSAVASVLHRLSFTRNH